MTKIIIVSIILTFVIYIIYQAFKLGKLSKEEKKESGGGYLDDLIEDISNEISRLESEAPETIKEHEEKIASKKKELEKAKKLKEKFNN